MCFSATASFCASGLLLTTGLLGYRQIISRQQIPFATIPLLFAVQQFFEGFVWLSFTDVHFVTWRSASSSWFLFFAQVLWPIWVSMSIYLVEREERRKKILKILLFIGIAVAIYLSYCLIVYPVSVKVRTFHISYELSFPINLIPYTGIFYFLPTVLPSFFSTWKGMDLIGSILLALFVVTKFFFNENLISVWCFFAAVLSAVLLWVLILMRKEAKHSKAFLLWKNSL
jgi:hypothetical protein